MQAEITVEVPCSGHQNSVMRMKSCFSYLLVSALWILAPCACAQDPDMVLMDQLRVAMDNNPRYRADRERNDERHPICPQDLNALIKSAEGHARSWTVVGRCSLKRNDLGTAENAFRKASAIEPSSEAFSLLGLALIEESKLDDVPRVLRQGARLNPGDDQLFRAWGSYFRAKGDLGRAARYYKKAIDVLYPGGLGLFETDDDMATLGDIYREMGDHQDAIDAYKEACFGDICPDSHTILNYGRELILVGRADAAKTLVSWVPSGQEQAAKQLRAELNDRRRPTNGQ
jgi:tetratricopeptide (TPR) repeat protein